MPKGREASTQRCRWCFTRGKFCGHDDIDRWKIELRQAKAFADLAPEAIARNGIACGFHRNCQPDSRMCETVGFHAEREEAIVDAPPARVDRVELQLATQTQLRTKT